MTISKQLKINKKKYRLTNYKYILKFLEIKKKKKIKTKKLLIIIKKRLTKLEKRNFYKKIKNN